ncbi:MAG: DUF4136 domain-containing protein [Acidiferrobacterales bacterium]
MTLRTNRRAVMLLLTALAGCSTMQVNTDFDPAADFGILQTYNWMPGPQKVTGDPRLDNEVLEKRIHTAVENQLNAQGFRKQSSRTPDFLVGYHVALEKKLAVSTMNTYYGYRAGWGWSYGVGTSAIGPESYTYEYEQGSLILDIVDGDTRRLIWRGSAQTEVNKTASPEKRQAQINEAVKKMLEQFPPKSKK